MAGISIYLYIYRYPTVLGRVFILKIPSGSLVRLFSNRSSQRAAAGSCGRGGGFGGYLTLFFFKEFETRGYTRELWCLIFLRTMVMKPVLIFSFDFVMQTNWQSATRRCSQNWLQTRYEKRQAAIKIIYNCPYILATCWNVL